MSEPGIRERLVGCWRLAGFAVTGAEGNEYSGPFEVDEPAGTVAHHVEVSAIPSWLGTTQIRRVQFREPGSSSCPAPNLAAGTAR